MRTLIVSLAAAASALAVASPAAAQWGQYPAPQGYGYGYGQQHNYGQMRALQVRVQQLRDMIRRLDRRDRLSSREARRLDYHAVALQRQIHAAGYRGLNRRERFEIERRIEGLRQAIRYEARDGNRWGWNGHDGYGNGYGYYGSRHQRGDDDRRHDRDDDDDRYGGDDNRRGDRDGRRDQRDDGDDD